MVGGSVDVTTWNSVTVVIPTERQCYFKQTESRDIISKTTTMLLLHDNNKKVDIYNTKMSTRLKKGTYFKQLY